MRKTAEKAGSISIDHSLVDPMIDIRCLLCLNPLEAPYTVITVGTLLIYADDECWDQLSDMVTTVREEHSRIKTGKPN